jgi:hypothetical protein
MRRHCDHELQPQAFKTISPVFGTFASAHARAFTTKDQSKGVINGVADSGEEGVSLRWPLSNREKINLDEDLRNMMELDIFIERCCFFRLADLYASFASRFPQTQLNRGV